jgi:hypothetical protein
MPAGSSIDESARSRATQRGASLPMAAGACRPATIKGCPVARSERSSEAPTNPLAPVTSQAGLVIGRPPVPQRTPAALRGS